jgi:uncharacterized membrane protein YkoI
MRYPIAFILTAAIACGPAFADNDHDRARRAVEEGRILPLKDILAQAESAYPGELIEAELEDEHGFMIYEIKMLTRDGRVMKLLYDAHTGRLLKANGGEGRR